MGWVGEEEALSRRRSEGRAAESGEATFTQIASAAMRSAWVVDNLNARAVALEEAYDRRSDAIFAATGNRPTNPFRRGDMGALEMGQQTEDPFAAYQRELEDLSRDHPDKRDVIRAEVSPRDDAARAAREASAELDAVTARWRGVWGGGAIAAFAGGMAGSLRDPAATVANLLGPTGRAGNGLKGLAWMAAKQGAVNAGLEVAFQPAVASWRREAGLGYDATTFATNVGGAFALGGALDMGVRGAFRAVQGVRGRVPILDDAGGVAGWETPEASLERAARKSTNEMLRKAADLDAAALKQLTKETPLADDPMMRALWEQYDDLQATTTRAPGVAEAVDDAASLQAMRAMLDPAEPPPAPVRPDPQVVYRAGDVVSTDYATAARQDAPVEVITVPPERAVEVQVAADGAVRVPADLEARPMEPGVAEARQALIDGTLSEHEAAALIRERPEVLDGSVPIDTGFLREARAVARLSDAAFDMVMQGEARPQMGALVHDLVADPARHAGILRQLEDLRPETPAEARKAIGVLMREASPPRLVADGGGIDDVHGKDGQKQIEALERQLGLVPDKPPAAAVATAPDAPAIVADPPPLMVDRSDMLITKALDAAAGMPGPLWENAAFIGRLVRDPAAVDAWLEKHDIAKLAPFGVGAEAVVFDAGDGRVVRVAWVPRIVPKDADYLQPLSSARIGDVHLDISPKLDKLQESSPAFAGLLERLRGRGVRWDDPKPQNAGLDASGKAVALDGRFNIPPAIVADPPPLMTAMAHPAHPTVTLPVNPDGTVTFWRLGKPHKGEKGNTWTSSRAQVEAYAQRAPGREIVRLDVKPEDLAEVAPFGADTSRADSPEMLSVGDFRSAAKLGVLGPDMNEGFARIKRSRVDLREDQVLRHVDHGLNFGYSTDDIAHYYVHNFLLANDPDYSRKYVGDFSMNEELREQLRNSWSDQQIDAAYYDLLGRSRRRNVRNDESLFVISREMAAGEAKVVGEVRASADDTAQMRADAADMRRAREPQAGMRVDPSGLPETPRGPPAGAPRQSSQDTAASVRVLQGNARKIVTAMRREGIDGVEKAIDEMGPAGMRDAAARLAADRLRDLADMEPRAKAALLGARALAAVADEMDRIRGGGGGEMRSVARDLEARATAGDVAGSGLGREVTHFERVLRAVETRGKAGVEREIDLMGKVAARELGERLLPGRMGEWDQLPPARQADLLTRALLSGRMAMSEARRASIEGQALKGAAEGGTDISLRSMLDDAEALTQLADLIRECKL